MRYCPIFLDLRGRRCVVVVGRLAERNVRAPLQVGAWVRMISPDLTPRLAPLASEDRISLTRRAYQEGDLNGAVLVFAAAEHPATQRAVREDGEAVGALVNVVDNREDSSVLVPASFAQGDLLVATSTCGASPALTRRLRNGLRETLGREYRAHLDFIRKTRKQVMGFIPTSEKGAWVFRELAAKLGADWFAGPQRAEDEVKKVLRKSGIKARR